MFISFMCYYEMANAEPGSGLVDSDAWLLAWSTPGEACFELLEIHPDSVRWWTQADWSPTWNAVEPTIMTGWYAYS